MMETASPRLSERETPDRIAIGPRGDGYCFVRFVASSKRVLHHDTVGSNEANLSHHRSDTWLQIAGRRARCEVLRSQERFFRLGREGRVGEAADRYWGNARALRSARNHL